MDGMYVLWLRAREYAVGMEWEGGEEGKKSKGNEKEPKMEQENEKHRGKRKKKAQESTRK